MLKNFFNTRSKIISRRVKPNGKNMKLLFGWASSPKYSFAVIFTTLSNSIITAKLNHIFYERHIRVNSLRYEN